MKKEKLGHEGYENRLALLRVARIEGRSPL